MKQKLTESWDFKVLLHLCIHFSNNLHLATIEFRMRRFRCSFDAVILLMHCVLQLIYSSDSSMIGRIDVLQQWRAFTPNKSTANLYVWVYIYICVHIDLYVYALTSLSLSKVWLNICLHRMYKLRAKDRHFTHMKIDKKSHSLFGEDI